MAKDYNISKTAGLCTTCEKQLEPEEDFVAVLRDTTDQFLREDFCIACWDAADKPEGADIFGIWHSKVPTAQEKKKLLIDDDLLINFFRRLDGESDEMKITFRFVLALVLMRKRLLIYDRLERRDDGDEVWLMHLRGSDETHEVLDPKMDEDKIAEVSGQLGQILNGEI